MILIASDKYKGTLTAREVCDTIASVIGPDRCICCPMADGGEGTAGILANIYGMRRDPRGWYAMPDDSVAAVDSSEHIGIGAVAARGETVMTASSSPLGKVLYEMQLQGYNKIYVGIGGTGTCDGGLGLMQFPLDPSRFIGLSDVQVPLLAPDCEPSALMFVQQKGARAEDLPLLRERLQYALLQTERRSPYDGAGGGVGFGLASLLGAECIPGARAVLQAYNIDWSKIDHVITGEGCMDRQTAQGKVVHELTLEAEKRNIPVTVIAGTVRDGVQSRPGMRVLSTTDYLPNLPLTHGTALLRLRKTVK